MSKNHKEITIITGASGGIGLAIAQDLIARGHLVAGLDLEIPAGTTISDESRYLALTADVRDPQQIDRAINIVIEQFGIPTNLINAAGIGAPYLTEELPQEIWEKIISVNLTGTFNTTRALLRVMVPARHGRIINIASVAGKRISYSGCVAYTASKSGVLGLTRHLAFEYARYGITINAICPSTVITPMVRASASEEVISERSRQFPIGRPITPSDVLHGILFLLAPEAAAICGLALDIDGGIQLGWDNVDHYYERRRAMTRKYQDTISNMRKS